MESAHLKVEHWRKSSQWVALTREHAELVAGPGPIHDAFEKCADAQNCFILQHCSQCRTS